MADQWFSPGTPVSSTNKTDITVILLKVGLNTHIEYKQDSQWNVEVKQNVRI